MIESITLYMLRDTQKRDALLFRLPGCFSPLVSITHMHTPPTCTCKHENDFHRRPEFENKARSANLTVLCVGGRDAARHCHAAQETLNLQSELLDNHARTTTTHTCESELSKKKAPGQRQRRATCRRNMRAQGHKQTEPTPQVLPLSNFSGSN